MQLLAPIDHIQEGISRLISQYRSKPRLAAWIMVYLDQLQHIEDALHATVSAWDIDTATGWRLTVLGTLVGQQPFGDNDDVFRTYIKARIRANRSTGRLRELLEIADILIPGYKYRQLGNNVYFWPLTDTIDRPVAEAVQNILQRACSQGGRVWVYRTTGQPLIRVTAAACAGTSFADIPGGHSSGDPNPTNAPGLYAGVYSPETRL
jgi:hypothetical protein